MVNIKQLRILRQGVNVWNEWKDNNPNEEIDLSDSNLSNDLLIDADFYEADLTRTNFSHSLSFQRELSSDDLLDTELFEANLSYINFGSANLYKAKLHYSNLEGSYFNNADLSFADLSYSRLDNTDFNDACLRGTKLIGVTMDQTSLINTDLSGADISGATIKDINTSRWTIKKIKCSHIFRDGKRIDYAEGEFEKAYTQIENLIEMIIDIPFSDMTYYIGRIIEEAANLKHGEASLLFKTQTALSNNTTKFEFMSFSEPEKLDDIKQQLANIQNSLKPVIDDAKAKNESKNIIGIKDEVDILPVLGLVARPKEINRFLIERYNTMSPFVQQVMNIIQSVFQ